MTNPMYSLSNQLKLIFGLVNSNVMVVSADTGLGKTTRIPTLCLYFTVCMGI